MVMNPQYKFNENKVFLTSFSIISSAIIGAETYNFAITFWKFLVVARTPQEILESTDFCKEEIYLSTP